MKSIFINLPVADLAISTAFYEAVGFERNATFSNDHGSAMVWAENIYVMLSSHDFYRTLTAKPIADTQRTSAMLIALSFDSREAVDTIVGEAIGAGGRELHPPEDLGFMYSRAFEDPDGHGFGPFWMDLEAANQLPAETVDAG